MLRTQFFGGRAARAVFARRAVLPFAALQNCSPLQLPRKQNLRANLRSLTCNNNQLTQSTKYAVVATKTEMVSPYARHDDSLQSTRATFELRSTRTRRMQSQQICAPHSIAKNDLCAPHQSHQGACRDDDSLLGSTNMLVATQTVYARHDQLQLRAPQ